MTRTIEGRDAPAEPATGPPEDAPQALRRLAEERVQAFRAQRTESVPPSQTDRLLAELQIHQIELEMQNEELRRTQEALEVSRARYFDLYDLAPMGYVALAERGLIGEANLAAATLLGATRGALVGQPLSHFVHPEDQDIFYLCRQRLFETGERQTCELRLRRMDGESFWAGLEASLGQYGETGNRHWRVILSDIGTRKRAEEARYEEDRCKDRFIALLGHELRNPLAPIRSVSEILRLAPTLDVAQIQRLSEILGRQVSHLARLVDDVLDVARIRRGTVALDAQPCDLREAAECAVEQVRPLLAQRRQRLDTTLPGTPVVVNGDPIRLAQAIVNLLRNASQSSREESLISMTLESADGKATVRIQDRGIGIDPQLLPRLFDPFVRAGQSPESANGGLGLGLALVKGLMDLHGGTVEAQSAGPGQGSAFILRLSLLPAPSAPSRSGLGRAMATSTTWPP